MWNDVNFFAGQNNFNKEVPRCGNRCETTGGFPHWCTCMRKRDDLALFWGVHKEVGNALKTPEHQFLILFEKCT